LICTLSIHGYRFTFKHLCWHSITKILRNGPRAHFPFKLTIRSESTLTPLSNTNFVVPRFQKPRQKHLKSSVGKKRSVQGQRQIKLTQEVARQMLSTHLSLGMSLYFPPIYSSLMFGPTHMWDSAKMNLYYVHSLFACLG
jgi:hypothetical protein